MNIAITHEFPFEKKFYGGGNQIVKGLSIILAQKNHNVTILTNGKDEFNLNNNILGIRYKFLTKFSKTSFLKYYLKLFFYLLNNKPDYVISFTSESFFVALYCKILKINSSLYQASPEFPNFSKFNYNSILNIRYKLGIYFQFLGTKYTPHVYTISDYTTKMIIKEWRVDENKVSTMGLGLDQDILNDSSAYNIINFKTSDFNILSFGRITFVQKPFHLIVEPLSNLTNYWKNWTIIGDGPDLNSLKHSIDQHSLTDKVIFTGTLQSNEIIKYIKDSDIIILPSNYESFFITVYESLLYNKVVITDDVADIKSNFLSYKNIKIVNSKDPFLYQNTIHDIFKNYNRYILNSTEAASFIRNNFTWDNIINKIKLNKL